MSLIILQVIKQKGKKIKFMIIYPKRRVPKDEIHNGRQSASLHNFFFISSIYLSECTLTKAHIKHNITKQIGRDFRLITIVLTYILYKNGADVIM